MKRGIGRKIAFLRKGWKESPIGLIFWVIVLTAFGAAMLGGFLVSLLYWALGSPDPFGESMLNVPGAGPYDHFIWVLSGLLFTWMVGIPVSDWIDRMDKPKEPKGESFKR